MLSLKDLCTLDILPDIIEAGVYSLKIEGRMKSPRYTAGVVSIYRKYVDRYLEQGRDGYFVEPGDRKMLLDLFDRGGFTDGYYARHNGRGMVALREKPEFREGNQKLFEYLDKTYVVAELKEKVRGHVELAEGEPSRLTLESRGEKVQVLGQAPQAAENQPMTREKVLKQLNKTGGSPFSFETLTAQIEGDLFLPVQALNELRRTGFQELEKKLTGARVLTGEGGIGAQFRSVPAKTAAPKSQSVPAKPRPRNPSLSSPPSWKKQTSFLLCWPAVRYRWSIWMRTVLIQTSGGILQTAATTGENSAGWPFRRYSVPMPRGTWERTAACCARQALTAC